MKYHKKLKIAVLWLLIPILAAWATPRPDQTEVETAVETHRDRALDYVPSDHEPSFQDSPFGTLVNRAFRE